MSISYERTVPQLTPLVRKRQYDEVSSPEDYKMKRILKNRQAAQESRDRKKKQQKELEERVVFLEEENLALRKRMEFLEKQNQELILGLPAEQQQQIQDFDINEPEEDLSISTCSSPLSSNFDFSTTPEHFLELPSSPDNLSSFEITSTINSPTTPITTSSLQDISQNLNTEEIDNEKQKEENEMTIARNLIGKPAALTNYISLQLEDLLAIFFLLNFMDSIFTSQTVSLHQMLNYLIHLPLKNFPLTMTLSLKDIRNRYFEEKSRKKKFFSLYPLVF